MGQWQGGDAECGHKRLAKDRQKEHGLTDRLPGTAAYGGNAEEPWPDGVCGLCGAVNTPAGIGLEPTLGEWVQNIVAVGREIWRVLRDDGTFWLNVGDAYAGSWGNYGSREGKQRSRISEKWHRPAYENVDNGFRDKPPGAQMPDLAPKNLMGQPWRVAFALQDDGWILRHAIIWKKPNPMPGSQEDRPTTSYEHIFLLSKRGRYFFDGEPIREPSGAFCRDVWEFPTQGRRDAHFATFPDELPRRCILAGTSAYGVCSECGAPWYNGRYERVQGLPNRKGTESVSAANPQDVQDMRGPTTSGTPPSQYRERACDCETLQGCKQGTDCRSQKGISGQPARSRQYASGQSALLPEPQGGKAGSVETPSKTNRADGSRACPESSPQRETEGAAESGTGQFHAGRLGADVGEPEGQMLPLQQTVFGGFEANDGPYHPNIEGRPAHASEHSSSVQTLQFEQAQQDNLSGVTLGGKEANERKPSNVPGGRSKTSSTGWTPQRDTPNGWQASCTCGANTVPATVLDCFVGSGTTVAVAQTLGRRGVGLDLNPEYLAIAQRRIGSIPLPMLL